MHVWGRMNTLQAAAFALGVLAAAAAVGVMPFGAAVGTGKAGPNILHQRTCQQLVDTYLAERTQDMDMPQDPQKFVFFLHVPRTAGKTYFSCFLKSAYPPSRRCAKSYDHLRLNVSQDSCALLVSHDDASITQTVLPPGAAVITQLRRPVSRLLSAYEFAVDVAARRVHINESLAPKGPSDPHFISTLDVWPWSYLVPWFREDMVRRMAALREEARSRNQVEEWQEYKTPQNRTYWWSAVRNQSVWELPPPEAVLEPYDNPLVMPLKEWIEHPIARELVHNGQVLQVLGLTNYSHFSEHSALRNCFFSDPASAQRLREVAVQRLRRMHHVGLTEQLDDSVLSLAAALGLKLNSPTYRYTSSHAFSYDGGDLKDDQLVTYKATFPLDSSSSSNHSEGEGEQQPPWRVEERTVTIARARERIYELSKILWSLDEQLRVLTPKLQALVDTEEEWLDAQDAKRAASGAPPPPATPEGQQQKIDSPWAAEIEALDDKVADMQEEMERGKAELDSLRSVAVVRVDEATGRAQQLVPDSHFQHREELGMAYRRCEKGGHERGNSKEDAAAFRHLRTPSHKSFVFSKQARKALDPAILKRIAELNALDELLYEEGKALLAAQVSQQRRQRRLESFINYDAQLQAQVNAQQAAEGQSKQAEGEGQKGRKKETKSKLGGAAAGSSKRARAVVGPQQIENDPLVHDEL